MTPYLVLASDNGYLYGDFGVVDKNVPWATPVVLRCRGRLAWVRPATTSYPTSNIDFAPTL